MPVDIAVYLGTAATVAPPVDLKPGDSNTGYVGTLTTLAGNQTITVPGTTIEGRDIYGRVFVQAANVTLRNCRIRGTMSITDQTLVDSTHPAVSNLLIEDCTLTPDQPSTQWNAVAGHDYTVRRCNVYGTVDGFAAHNTTYPAQQANVLIESSWVHDLHCWTPDPGHSDNRTHNDCIQIHGNGGVTIRGNNFTSNPGVTSAAGLGGMSCIMLTPGVSVAPNNVVEDNWFDYGTACLNLNRKDTSDTATSMLVQRNRFGRHGSKDGDPMTFRIIGDRYLSLPGLPASTGPDNTNGNVFDDTGLPITVNRS